MSKGKPKGPTPSLIGCTLGRPKKRLVARKSNCRRCDADILMGTVCHEIPQLGGSFSNARPYCDGCYAAILGKTKEDLAALVSTFEANGSPKSPSPR